MEEKRCFLPDTDVPMTRDALFAPFEVLEGDRTKGLVLIADHAGRALPDEYGDLGLKPTEFERHIAYDIGVRYFDVARSYGEGERFLASWLESRVHDRGRVTVGSKWGYTYTAGWQLEAESHEVKDHSLATLQRQYAESREILGDRLDLYQIHSAAPETGVLEDRAVLAELARLRAGGLEIGLTVTGVEQADTVRQALDVEVDGVAVFSTVQATWNLLERSVGPALDEAHDAGWGVIVKEAMANGRLAGREQGPGPEAPGAVLDRVAGRHGVGLDTLAIGAAAAQPWVDVVLSGAATPDQVRSNAAGAALALSGEDLLELEAATEAPQEYWRRRGELAWA
jgi:aryl-alcohol dehydrogenase-like predicted oxidoreductase